MNIEQKSLGSLIDELFTTNMKLWYAQEEVMSGNEDVSVIAAAAKKAQQLNARRTALMRAIDRAVKSTVYGPTEKTYA